MHTMMLMIHVCAEEVMAVVVVVVTAACAVCPSTSGQAKPTGVHAAAATVDSVCSHGFSAMHLVMQGRMRTNRML
jgi:hypothetical protein